MDSIYEGLRDVGGVCLLCLLNYKRIHSALNHFLQVKEYRIHKAYVFSNTSETSIRNSITYLPIYLTESSCVAELFKLYQKLIADIS